MQRRRVVDAVAEIADDMAAPAQGNAPQQPTTATQPSQPASAPGAAGRPSWAQ